MSAMFQSALHLPVFLAVFLWQLAVFLQCRAVDFHQGQDIRLSRQVFARCLENCAVLTTVSVNKVLRGRSCYEECLLRMMKQRFVGTPYVKPLSKRIRRDTSNGKENSIPAVDSQDQKECENGTIGGTALRPEDVTITLDKLGNTGRYYANVTWKPQHNKTVNWTGYKMIYLIGKPRDSNYRCRYLGKNVTSSILNNSSKGIVEGLYVRVMITSVPYLSGDSTPFYLHDKQVLQKIETTTEGPRNTGTVTPDTPFPTTVTTDTPFPTTVTPDTPFPTTDSGKDYIEVAVPVVSVVTVLIGVTVFLYVRRTSKFPTPDPEFRPEFDAFIIYSSEDKTFVTETLLPTLEKKHGFKCCIHYRDFTIGAPFRDNMVESVYKSRKTVAVASRNFFSSRHCGSELSIALHRLLQRGDDSVIVFKLDDVKGSKLPSALKKRSYIDYHSTHRQTWETRLVKCLTAPNRAFHPTAV